MRLAFFAAADMFTKRWKTNAALQREQAVLARQADSSSRGLHPGLFTAFVAAPHLGDASVHSAAKQSLTGLQVSKLGAPPIGSSQRRLGCSAAEHHI